VDTRLTDPVEGDIYAIAQKEGVQPLLRRAQRNDSGAWETVRDIPIRKPRAWPAAGGCLGKVVWASRMEF